MKIPVLLVRLTSILGDQRSVAKEAAVARWAGQLVLGAELAGCVCADGNIIPAQTWKINGRVLVTFHVTVLDE